MKKATPAGLIRQERKNSKDKGTGGNQNQTMATTTTTSSATKQNASQRGSQASNFPFSQEVYTVDADTTISEALNETLVRHGILSAPVWDGKKKEYIGFFDISDALAVLFGIERMLERIPSSKLHEQTVNIHGIELDLSESKNGQGTDLPVRNVVIQNGRTAPWNPVSPNADLQSVVSILGQSAVPPWAPCRRVPVMENGKIIKIISQSELVTQIYQTMVKQSDDKAPPPLFIQTPRTHKIGSREVSLVKETEVARIAFQLLVDKRISAVGVVNEQGKLTSAISTKDIWIMLQMKQDKEFPNPDQLKVVDFVKKARELAASRRTVRSEATTVSLDYPVHEIVAKLAEQRTHRVFVVDEHEKPVGVISVSDIVHMMMEDELPWPKSTIAHHLSSTISG